MAGVSFSGFLVLNSEKNSSGPNSDIERWEGESAASLFIRGNNSHKLYEKVIHSYFFHHEFSVFFLGISQIPNLGNRPSAVLSTSHLIQ